MTEPFVNWSRHVVRRPVAWARPTTEAEAVQVVQRAADQGLRVRAGGSRHSWSDVASCDGVVQVDLGAMDRLVEVDDDHVTVQAGATLHDVVRVAAKHGRVLPVLGSIMAQTVAGAVGTGTHGSSLQRGCLSDHVARIRLVDGQGTVRDLGPGDPALDGARLHLGRLGLVTELSLRTEPAFGLRETRTRVPLGGAAGHLIHLGHAHPFAKLWWLPGRDHALAYTYERIEPRPDAGGPTLVDRVANGLLFPALLRVAGAIPATIRPINALVDAVHLTPGSREASMHDALTLPMPPVHRETEWAVPLDRADEAWEIVRSLLRDRPLDFIVELRLVPRSPAWMAPSHDGDRLHLGVYAGRAPWLQQVLDEADEALLALGGRPHWGKEGARIAHRADWPGAARFRALVDDLDPRSTFAHATIDGAIGVG